MLLAEYVSRSAKPNNLLHQVVVAMFPINRRSTVGHRTSLLLVNRAGRCGIIELVFIH
jgi:hypothetical protein